MNTSPNKTETQDERSIPMFVTEVALQEQSGDERIHNGGVTGGVAAATVVALPMDMSLTLRQQIEDLQRQSELGQYQEEVDLERALPQVDEVYATHVQAQQQQQQKRTTPLRGGDSESTAHSVNMALLVLALVLIILGLIMGLLAMALK